MTRQKLATCSKCHRSIEFGRTVRNEDTGTGGKLMPLDPDDADVEAANVAVYRDATGRLNARVLKRGAPEPYERRRMPHFATCPALAASAGQRATDALAEIADNVIPFLPRKRPRR